MSFREIYENVLIELNKVQAPSLLINDFIYLWNKAVQQYMNQRYSLFETKQQLTDDLRVLTKTVCIYERSDPKADPDLYFELDQTGNAFDKSYACRLPEDYVHILNCICEFTNPGNKNCPTTNNVIQQGANKLDSNQWPHIINNYYMKPSITRPYYYIINLVDPKVAWTITGDAKKQNVTQGSQTRYGNAMPPIMQIKCGSGVLQRVFIDYLRAPEFVSLDTDILDDMNDNSQILEFPDYVIYEIINIMVKLILENTNNTDRTQTQNAVNATIQ